MSYTLVSSEIKEIYFSDLYLRDGDICTCHKTTFMSFKGDNTEVILEPMKELRTHDGQIILRVVLKDKFIGAPDDKEALKQFSLKYDEGVTARLNETFRKLLFLCGIVGKVIINDN